MVAFTVGGFNTRWGIERFGARANKPYDVMSVLERLDADVLVLPETWVPNDGKGVVDELEAAGYEVAVDRWITLSLVGPRMPASVPGDGWWSLAVASRLPVVARNDISMPRAFLDRAHPRAAINLTLEAGGTPIDVVGLHTSSRLWWGAPIVHLRGVRRGLPDFPGPALIAGDFNLWGPPVQLLFPGWHRTVRGRTYPSHRPHSQIDHVLVNDHLAVRSAWVVKDVHSDHRPVRVELEVKP